jgi:hypothetical protein
VTGGRVSATSSSADGAVSEKSVGPDLRGTLTRIEHGAGESGRSLLRWVLIAGAAVVIIVVAVVGFLFVRVRGPLDAANGYFGDLRARDYSGAYDRLCRPTRTAVSPDAFVAVMRPRLAGVFRIDDFAASPRVDVDGDRAEVDLSVTYRGAGSADVTVPLEKEDGEWKPCPDPKAFR